MRGEGGERGKGGGSEERKRKRNRNRKYPKREEGK